MRPAKPPAPRRPVLPQRRLQQQPPPPPPPEPECPEGCCDGTEILCVSIPCPINVVLLGIQLNLELPCIRLTSGSTLTGAQAEQLLGVLRSLLGGLGAGLPGTGGVPAQS